MIVTYSAWSSESQAHNRLRFFPRIFSKDLTNAQPNTIHYGHIVEKTSNPQPQTSNLKPQTSNLKSQTSNLIDEVLVSIFRAPHSYTGEDSAEISCHGSRYILNKVLELLIQHGCRMANPGEYTQRAFLNGKMDLSQAEAVADLIASGNKATHQIAMSQLRGVFSSELSQLREQLLKLTSLLELELDFSDHEDLEFADRSELLDIANKINNRITRLAQSFETGQALKNGIPVAIVGKTNVGKSTLLNRLLRDDRAIVSSVHGTTRDTVEDVIDLHGVTFRFIDTAGIRQTTDEVEQIGISRTYAAIQKARIVLWLIDAEPTTEDVINQLYEVHLGIDRDDHEITPGMTTMVTISYKNDGAQELQLPATSIIHDQQGPAVFVYRDGHVWRTPVEMTFIHNSGMAEIKGDIQSGDQVVVSGASRLTNGQEVRPFPEPSETNVGGLL